MILITTGRGSPDDNGMNTEIIDPEKSNFECNKVQPFPVFLYGAGGGLINGRIPFVCGGFSHGDPWTKEQACYQLTESGSWIQDETAVMNEARGYFTGSVVLDNQLVLSGGSAINSWSKSIELVAPNAKAKTISAQLPTGILWQCNVAWDSDTYMVIGGWSGRSRSETYFINVKTNEVRDGPPLNIARHEFGCGELKVLGTSYIVVSGGSQKGDNRGRLNSTEVLDKSNIAQGWQKGAILYNFS